MVKKIGRLSGEETNELWKKSDGVIGLFKTSSQKAKKELEKLVDCANYFGRKAIAKILASSDIKDEIKVYMKVLLDSEKYSKRATALFFFNDYYEAEPEKMIEIVSDYYDAIKWEAESIIDHYWKSHPKMMKENMMKWIESDDEQKRSLSFHGLENFCYRDPRFVMEFIEKIIDDDSIEVQKKITHTIIQVARLRPELVYPYLREWLTEADEKRIKTIWVSMKKLVNSLHGRGSKDRDRNFAMLTKETIKNWKNEKDKKVSLMGSKLYGILYHIKEKNKGNRR